MIPIDEIELASWLRQLNWNIGVIDRIVIALGHKHIPIVTKDLHELAKRMQTALGPQTIATDNECGGVHVQRKNGELKW